jgi:hypothetical protein
MDFRDHIAGVGAIVTNLQALETALRRFLVERYGQCPAFPKMGDATACRSYLTAYLSLGPLIKEYHGLLDDHEKQYCLDDSVVPIRDALAHGRLVARGDEPSPPYELWKFGGIKDGKVQVEFSEVLSAEWLKEKWAMIDAQKQKVVDCSKARGYNGLS